MLLFFVTCISFIFFYRYSLPIKSLPPWAREMRLQSFFFWEDLSILFPFAKYLNNALFLNFNSKTKTKTKTKTKKKSISKSITATIETTTTTGSPLLDLPELAIESILERLEPADLCRMACVSIYLRDICLSDHLWKNHMKHKWGAIFGFAAEREWQMHIASQEESNNCFLDSGKQRGFLMGYLSKLWHVMMFRASFNRYGSSDERKQMNISSQPPIDCSIVSCYRALETGNFWFPAQVFNRENGHVGFVMSCYDAKLCYDSHTDTFEARYPPHGTRAVASESEVTWDRIRAAPVDASPHDLHISDCLNDLRPKDHIEIQWRRNKQFPYGWWYGVVGHLESCGGTDISCNCHKSDTVVLEFNQYAPGSRWRHMMINRKGHCEEGNEADGFYGGIRKLYNKDEICLWQQFWPTGILE
ncbi:hypothetical protein L6452_26336 [Arctium lappa]|uniref:Uncharacterized protein n=1 Tax=Arctium lappa TaxID=4217 RepID=A0ACB9ABV4_ARCLA|nr:hypothetical protein L6452_26336 [Arctium lappa]